MLGAIEKKVLESINFPERFMKAQNEFQYNPEVTFNLNKKDKLKLLKDHGLPFVSKGGNTFYADLQKSDYTFRLLFDINKYLIPLTYIYILINDEFIKNGMSNLGKNLQYFDTSGMYLNRNFGLNSIHEFDTYINQMKSIFLDFVEEYMKLIMSENTATTLDSRNQGHEHRQSDRNYL